MAFEFLKKIVRAIAGEGEKSSGAKGRKDAGKGAGRGRRGESRSRGGKRGGQSGESGEKGSRSSQGAVREQKRGAAADGGEKGRSGRQRPARGDAQHRQQQQGAARRQPKDKDLPSSSGQQRGHGARRRNGPPPSNTAAGRMRPGGEISQEELAARKAEHEAWDPATFAVEPMEGRKRFHDFDLPSEVMHAIYDLGFKYCTEIQALSLEQALAGKNIAGKAQTGSGKTAAFLVAILTRYLRTPENRAKTGGQPRALVIAPTRELVIQICKDADALGRYSGLRSLAVYGGMDYDRQKREVSGQPVDLLVATPGRLLDFVKSHVINLAHVDTLVIDEADRMLDMGFIPDVRRIISYLPPKELRTTMLYSATLNETVMRLALNWMQEPYKAEVASETNATDTVRQVVYIVRAEDKFKVLFNHIALHPESRTLVFCNRKSTTEDVYDSLKVRGVKVEMLSGDVSQSKRLQVLDAFRDGEVRIVVATDVAGRGIHVDDVGYVINFDFPYEAEDYVHRIGRTGRAGNTGIAISFADEDESFAIPDIEAYIKETLKCTMIQEDDPLLKPLPPRGSRLAAVDDEARAAVDAREAVGEDEKAAAAALTGVNAATASGAPARLRSGATQRQLPKFEKALDPKKPMRDETEVYTRPVRQKDKLKEWSVPGEASPEETAKPETAEASAKAQPQQTTHLQAQ